MNGGPVEETWTDVARAKLTRILGPAQGEQALRDALSALRMKELRTADDLARLGDVLTEKGGFVGAVGVALKTHAILRGAGTR